MNQNQVKLIAIDMDGTLLNSQKEIPEENIKAIQDAAAAGIKIVLCTGRPRSGIVPHFEKLKIGPCFNLKVYLALKWKHSCRLAKTSQGWL